MGKDKQISKAVIKRLPRYRRYLRELQKKGVEKISSKDLSHLIGYTASQIRQDLNNFGGFGQQGYGYSVDYFAYSGIDKLGSQRGCTMITCKPDTTFAIDKYNYYSDRYELDGFDREEVTMQFADVTVVPDENRV